MWVQVMDGDGTQRSSAPNTLYSYDGQSPERPCPQRPPYSRPCFHLDQCMGF